MNEMKLISKAMDITFRHLAPERVLNALLGKRGLRSTASGELQQCFLSAAESALHGYSEDEQELILQNVLADAEREGLPPFSLLTRYGSTVLDYGQGGPVCRFEHVLDWRQNYLKLGQDLITTAWLADRAHTCGLKPQRFAWTAVIPTDHAILNQIVHSGLAENHHHLYGSSQVFSITWSQVMTYPQVLHKEPVWFSSALQARMSRGVSDNAWTTQRRLAYAVFLRWMLFNCLDADPEQISDYTGQLLRFDQGYFADTQAIIDLTPRTTALRQTYGVKFPQPDGQPAFCLDYAFTRELAGELNEDHRLLAGERYFMYHCFLACFSQRFPPEVQWMFYIYLLLKANFRTELVQTNQQVGFRNFQNYQSRKGDLWQMPAYWNEACRTSLNAPINEQDLLSLETRITPSGRANDIRFGIYAIDRVKLFFDGTDVHRYYPPMELEQQIRTAPFFFVLHFPKRKDHTSVSSAGLCPMDCRHGALRKKLRWQAIELAKALSNYAYLCRRVRGIDACANEIGCRPETFSNMFRFLRSFPPAFYQKNMLSAGQPHLSVTYHVGEDFLDITDGLRAIDEAILFLNLKRGDRLGHALALGVDPLVHYETKNGRVVLPKQDYLDNLVWLYYRSAELNVTMPLNLKHMLRSEAEVLFKELYQDVFQDPMNCQSLSIQDYYCSWFLRGDAPSLYQPGKGNDVWFSDFYDSFAQNKDHRLGKKLEQYRSNERISMLCHAYHYSPVVRSSGYEVITMDISSEYVELVAAMQQAMQQYVNDQGISIECNPSSNTLIGTFQGYQRHPILSFNNMGLRHSPKAVQMHVSINTDDAGVFDTSLSFEYALIAAQLSRMVSSEEGRLYSDREIEKYLRGIQQMGLEQIFP